MPRRRMLDPDFWKDESVKKLTREERLFFIGCISHADDEGRLLAHPAYLKASIFMYDDDLDIRAVKEIRDSTVAKIKNLLLYKNGEEEYIALLKWNSYQKPSHSTPSKLPAPHLSEPLQEPLSEPLQEPLSEPLGGSLGEVRGGEVRKGEVKDPTGPMAQQAEPVGQMENTRGKKHQKEAGLFLDLVERHEQTKLLNRKSLMPHVRKLFRISGTTVEKIDEFYCWLRDNDPFLHNKEPPLIIRMMPDKYPSWCSGSLQEKTGQHRDVREDRRPASDYSGEW